jgi:hypothetical protein
MSRPAAARLACAALAIVAMSACHPIEISPAPMTGVMGGVAWSLGTAESDPFLSMGEPELWVDMWPDVVAPCTDAVTVPRRDYLVLGIPRAAGDYDLGEGLTATFVLVRPDGGRTTYVTDHGRIVVDQVTATLIRGGAALDYDTANHVNGRFEVSVCP